MSAEYAGPGAYDLARGRRAYAWLVCALLFALGISAGNYYYAAGEFSRLAKPLARAATHWEGDRVVRDWLMRTPAGNLVGLVPHTELIRRFVIMVDRLAERGGLQPVVSPPGDFLVAPMNDVALIHPANADRYAPYIASLMAFDAGTLAAVYRQAYPLLQRAYQELGRPGREFNDRLLAAIDDMLAAPEIEGPLEVVHRDSFYEFADPDLASRSPAQKLMLRIGADHELSLKRKLAELRGLLAAGRMADSASPNGSSLPRVF